MGRTCSVEGCDKPHASKGLCEAHKTRRKRHGDVRADVPVRAKRGVPLRGRVCETPGCNRPHCAKGLCRRHRDRLEKHGDVQASVPIRAQRERREPRTLTLPDGTILKVCTNCLRAAAPSEFYPPNQECKDCTKWRAKVSRERIESRYARAKEASRRRGVEWQLSYEDYLAVVNDKACTYCDGELPVAGCGLDRKDERGPYSKENVAPCCTQCNRRKGACGAQWPYEDFLELRPILIAQRLRREALASQKAA